MEKQTYITSPTASVWATNTKRIEDQHHFERNIEYRSNIVSKRVAALAESRFPGLRKFGDSGGDELEDLLVREARLRWLVRVARYSQAPSREPLWREAERALLALERITEAISRRKCA